MKDLKKGLMYIATAGFMFIVGSITTRVLSSRIPAIKDTEDYIVTSLT